MCSPRRLLGQRRGHVRPPAPRRRTDRRGRRGDRASAAWCWSRRPPRAVCASSRNTRGGVRVPGPVGRSWPVAVSAATTTWCARTGRRGWGACPKQLLSGVPAHVDGRMMRHQPRPPAPASSTATGCGTTPRASPITTRCGPCTASGSCRARPRCGWTPPVNGCRSPLYPGFDTLGTLEYIATTGQDYTWFVLNARDHRQGVRRCPGRSRTPTSPAAASRRVLAARHARGGADAGAGLRRQGRGLRHRQLAARVGDRDERACPMWCHWTTPPSRPR